MTTLEEAQRIVFDSLTYPWKGDNGEYVEKINEGEALAELLLKEIVMVYPGLRQTIGVAVMCNDVFGYACADAEEVPYGDILDVWKAQKNNPIYGVLIWLIHRRKCKPIQPHIDSLKEAGLWTEEMENYL